MDLNSTTRANLTHLEEGEKSAVLIDDGSEKMEFLCSVEVPAPDLHYTEDRTIDLIRGGKQKQTDRIVETYGGGNERIMVVDDPTFAIGYYIHLLEIHDIKESEVHDQLPEYLDYMYDEYIEWRDTLSLSDRKLRLLDQVEHDLEYDDFYQTVLEEGTWRQTGLSAKQQHRVSQRVDSLDTNPKFCYKNARRAITEWWNDETAKYVEGVALSKHASRIIGHAWVELDGRVAELTWPWHIPDPHGTGAVYYGVEVSREELKQHEINSGPLVLNIDDPSLLG